MSKQLVRYLLLMVFVLPGLTACGGGGGGGSASAGGTGGTGVVSTGVITDKGSIFVNGIEFTTSGATIKVDDNPVLDDSFLSKGMVVKVRGTSNDLISGIAQQVEAENEVRGTVQTANPGAVPPFFTVVGQIVFVDDLTVFANFSSAPASPSAAVNALNPTVDVVEVHGLRNAAGNIIASRVELIGAPGANIDELRGIVKTGTITPTTFTLQNGATDVTVDYSGATPPVGASLANGVLVEVHGSFNGTTFIATRVDIEDLEDVQFEHAAGEEFEFEGLVSNCNTDPCTSFLVGTQAVQTNANTRFENGSAADLADSARVEAEGHNFVGVTLIAEKIEFKRTRVILTGVATVTGSIPGTGTLQLLDKSVQITSLTEIRQSGGILTGERVEVRGFVDNSGTIVAERVDDNAGGGNKDIVQARVTDKVGPLITLAIGINADLASATQFSDANEQPIQTLAAFLAAVTPAADPGGTLVKVKGVFNSGTNTIAVEEAELEN